MVRYNIEDLNDEMVLGESIFLPSGELLLAAGFRIKERYRSRLKQLGYTNVLIDAVGTESVKPQSVVSKEAQQQMDQSLNESSNELDNAFQQFRSRSKDKVKEIVKENRQFLGKFIMTTGMTKALEQFVDEIMNQNSIVLNLSAMQQTKPQLVNHAMNVTITSLCIGKKYKFSYEEMKQLGIGALNYDLGLIALPKHILEKKECEMAEEELNLFKQHTIFGHLMLSQNHVIPATSAAVALQHHEQQDGNGYPQKIKGDNRPPLKDFSRQNMIHRFAEIVAVACTYDDFLTGRRRSCEKLNPKQAIREIITLGGTVLNSDIVRTLVSIVPLYPVGARIRIKDAPTSQLVGYIGVVARDNLDNLENPQIILYETKNHQKIKPILIDLSKHKGFVLQLVV
ncbi:MAG: HD-GYP domain-containing protein [Chitinispirillaceae bacterium]